jgi:flagellar biosynthetic protein FliR
MMAIPDPATFLLVLARAAGLTLGAPILGHLLVPRRVRAGLALLLALALLPVVPAAPTPASLWGLAGAVGIESAFGALLGFVAQLVFAAVALGGELAGIQMGFGMVHLLDPHANASITIVAQWQQLLALLVFLALDGHHLLLRALIASFTAAPPGHLVASAAGGQAVVALAGEVFATGARLAAPVMIALLLTNGALGILARTIPQLNVFIIGFPVTVGVGLVMLGASLPFTFRLLATRFADLEPVLDGLARGFADG